MLRHETSPAITKHNEEEEDSRKMRKKKTQKRLQVAQKKNPSFLALFISGLQYIELMSPNAHNLRL